MRLVILALTALPHPGRGHGGGEQLLHGRLRWKVALGKVHNLPSKLLRLTHAAPSITNNPDFSFYPQAYFASVGGDRIALWAHMLVDQEIELVPSACS